MSDLKNSENLKIMYFQFKQSATRIFESEARKLILASAEDYRIEIGKALSVNEILQQKLEQAFNACPDENFQTVIAFDIGELLRFHKTLAEEPDNIIGCAMAVICTLAISQGSQILERFI